MENRYQDNISPEPSATNVQECYKTPNFQQFSMNSLIGFNNLYPTPPSDNDDNSHESSGYNNAFKASNYYMTPKTTDNNYYALDSVENKYPSAQQYNSTNNLNNQSFEENSQSNVEESNKENETQPNNSRFKRRSRTTYTKNQVIFIEKYIFS
jgi:hypothetical protein